MTQDTTLCEHTKIRLIAAAIGHQQCTLTDGTEVLIPGTAKRILVGDDAYLARMALPAAVEQPAGNPRDWLIDGSLLYRLNDDGDRNIDEINITMVRGSRNQEAREAAAAGLLNIICASDAAHLAAQPQAAQPTDDSAVSIGSIEFFNLLIDLESEPTLSKRMAVATFIDEHIDRLLARQSQPSTLGCAVPAGVTLKTFQSADSKQWNITIQHPFGTSWVRISDPRDVKLAELLAAAPQAPAAQEVPPASEVQADEAELYRDLTGDAMALGFDGIPAALEALPVAGVAQEATQQAAKADTVGVSEELRERLRDAVADALVGLYHCGRVWSAWSYGTMSEDDFSPANEDDDIIENVTAAAIGALAPTTSTVSAPGVQPLVAALRQIKFCCEPHPGLTMRKIAEAALDAYALASPTSPDSSGQAGAQAVRNWDYMRANHAGAIADALGCMSSDIESQIALRTSGTGSVAPEDVRTERIALDGHSPLPWKRQAKTGANRWRIVDANGRIVGDISHYREEAEANMELVLAALRTTSTDTGSAA